MLWEMPGSDMTRETLQLGSQTKQRVKHHSFRRGFLQRRNSPGVVCAGSGKKDGLCKSCGRLCGTRCG
jgi:hypothetical protein